MKTLVWFRNDLRIHDNPALKAACQNSSIVSAIFIFSQKQFEEHNESNVKINFLIQNLFHLSKKLSKFNIPLTIISSSGFNEDPKHIEKVCKDREITKVFCNSQFGIDEELRDLSVKNTLEKNNIKWESFHDQVIYEPGSLKTGQGQPYSVFTPFKRKWIENFDISFLDINYSYDIKDNQNFLSNISNFDFNFSKTHQVDMTLWSAGEDAAQTKLEEFLNNKILDYSKNRNDPILDGTSRISPYLALGVISSKKCILEALKINQFEFTSGNIGITKWIDEIIWREFYKNIMYCFPKVSKGKPFQDYSNNIKWRYSENEFHAWKEGKTGFPIVDAAMRQLIHEGWMHNRLRMVVAMFFTKNMLHDWRLGEAYFMKNLIDGDFASNNGGWQWSASTGVDAAPYFRIFNTITQSEKFDEKGDFIKKWVPEISSAKNIHDPSTDERNDLGYSNHLVDLKKSRKKAIDAFSNFSK